MAISLLLTCHSDESQLRNVRLVLAANVNWFAFHISVKTVFLVNDRLSLCGILNTYYVHLCMEASDSWKTVMGYYIHDLDNDLSFLTTEKN